MTKRRKESSKLFLFFCFFCLFLIIAVSFKLFLDRRLRKSTVISPIPAFSLDNTLLENLKTLLSKNNISFSQIASSDSAIIVWLVGGEEVILAPNASLEKQISSLQLILSRLTIEGKRFARLDFRFDKPVVSFK